MVDSKLRRGSKIYLRLIRFIGVIVPRRPRADWRQEWEAELRYRGMLVAVRLLAKRICARPAMSSRPGANKHTASSARRPFSTGSDGNGSCVAPPSDC